MNAATTTVVPSAAARSASRPERSPLRWGGLASGVAVALALPWCFSSAYAMNVLATLLVNAVLASGLAIVVRSGRLSLAQATFSGLGAYVAAYLSLTLGWNFWLATLVASMAAALFGLALGLLGLRLQGFYFAIATFVFSQLVIVVLGAWTDVTGGLSGMFGLPALPTLFCLDLSQPLVFYHFMLLVLGLSLALHWWCTAGSRFGRGLSALGADELLASSIGVAATRTRLYAFAAASALAGMAGSLNAHFTGGISPSDVLPAASVFILVMVAAGGARSLIGPVLGAAILTTIPELLRASAQWAMVLYGVFLLCSVFLFRDGLWSLLLQVRRAKPLAPRDQSRMGLQVLLRPVPAATGRAGRPSAGTLSFEQLGCAFDSNWVLRELGLTVLPGRLQGIIGPNGAGKTTLFNVITANAPMTAGRLLLNGQALPRESARIARLGVGRSFQQTRVFTQQSVQAAVATAAEMSGGQVDAAYLDWVLDVTGLSPLRAQLGQQLSHAQRRLLCIAMALAGRPQLLLLDEPLAGLDDSETEQVRQVIAHVHSELACTVLLIEHKLSVVMSLCGWLTVLERGQVIAEGVPADIARHPAVLKAYLGDAV